MRSPCLSMALHNSGHDRRERVVAARPVRGSGRMSTAKIHAVVRADGPVVVLAAEPLMLLKGFSCTGGEPYWAAFLDDLHHDELVDLRVAVPERRELTRKSQ